MRPNILLIHSDQHRFDCLGVNGHPLVQTPHLDQLAAEGTNFTRAFTPNPVCSPARACLQTGAWATTHGCVTIPGTEAYQPADPALPALTQLLADSGYRVGHVGKFHGETSGLPTDHGVEEFVGTSRYPAWRAAAGLPEVPTTSAGGGTDPVEPDQTALGWGAGETERLLEKFSDPGRPFFVRWDPVEPHLPNVVPEPYASMIDPADIAPWPGFDDPLENKPHVQRRTRERWGTDSWTWEDWQPVVARNLGEIALLDAQVGRLLATLDRLGIADRTLVIYTTDHGDMCGSHGMMDKHFVMYDDVLRVPLIARWPGQIEAGTTCENFVSNELDVARTLLGVADVPVPESFVGRDLLDRAAPKCPDIFAQYQGTHQGLYSQRMVRDERWKYVYNPVSIDELYDLENDPGEITNRVGDSAVASELARLQGRMTEWMTVIDDPLSPPTFRWGSLRRS